ncbi:Ilt1 protein [Martiniozyma asiatica (nom. inval.)]|nr:Ilt1 protein [Martiniozyma asiatica]
MTSTSEDTVGTILGTIGTVFWCIQLSPQIYFLYKRKSAEGFPPIFMCLWCLSGIPMSIYFIVSNTYIVMQLQPHLFTILCSIAWIQSMYYPPYQFPKKKIITLALTFYLAWIGFEVGFSVWLRPLYARGIEWPDLIFGIISSVLLAIGLLPPYFELWKRKGQVVGINFVFLALDSTGAVFSMASMLVGTFDAMGMSLYVIILVLELGIFTSQAIWWLRFRWRKGKDANEESTSNIKVDYELNDYSIKSQQNKSEEQNKPLTPSLDISE